MSPDSADVTSKSNEEVNVDSHVNEVVSQACYSPIETFEDLLNYAEDEKLSPTCTLLQETVPLAKTFCDVKIQVNGRRFVGNSCPKTLVCHDFKGGYLDDRFVNGTSNPVNYVFRHWLQTDIFCYFSHKFVTIPPLGWINAGHRHGTQVIGTIITESEEGKQLCQKLLKDRQTIQKTVEKLCLVAAHYKFDGYLVNIENELEKPQEMIEFLRLLTVSMKAVESDSVVLWYDSVTVEGKLDWQNELNNNNKAYFDVCDGIYLNYGWKDDHLHRSVEVAEDREYDVYVGIDVFGRGCFGGGGHETCQAVEKVAAQRLSIAIFAPGWSFELHPYEDFPAVDDQLWNKCAKYFYFRTIVGSNSESHDSSTMQPLSLIRKTNYAYEVFLSTDFNQGFGDGNYLFGLKKQVSCDNGPWYNLNEQSYQPVINCFRQSDGNANGFIKAFFDSKNGFLGGGSLKLSSSVQTDSSHTEPACPIWIPLHVPLDKDSKQGQSKCAIIAVVAWQKSELISTRDNNPIILFVEFMKPNISTRKVIRLSNMTEQIAFEMAETPITIHLKDFFPKRYTEKFKEIENLTFSIKNVPYAEHTLNDWTISCFLVDTSSMCLDWNITAVRLGAQQTVSMGHVSLALLSRIN